MVWELEVGHTVTPAQGLPERIYAEAFDDPTTLAAFVDAMRWGAVTSADPNRYQAPFRSGRERRGLPARAAAPRPGSPAHQPAARRRRRAWARPSRPAW